MPECLVGRWEFLVSLGGNDKEEEEDVVDPVRHPL